MRLIDADAFKEYMRKALEETRDFYPDKGEWAEAITEQFCTDIDDQPTIEQQQTCEYWDSESKFCTLCRPSVQPQRADEWCTDCAEYDHEKHCCPRFNQVIWQTLDESKTGKWIERKHGYWSFVNDKGERDGWIPSYECSECGSGGWRNPEVMNFCPNCGAKMEADKTDGAS